MDRWCWTQPGITWHLFSSSKCWKSILSLNIYFISVAKKILLLLINKGTEKRTFVSLAGPLLNDILQNALVLPTFSFRFFPCLIVTTKFPGKCMSRILAFSWSLNDLDLRRSCKAGIAPAIAKTCVVFETSFVLSCQSCLIWHRISSVTP